MTIILLKVTLTNANSAQTVLQCYTKYSQLKCFDYVLAVVFSQFLFISRQSGVFLLSICKSNTPFTSVINEP